MDETPNKGSRRQDFLDELLEETSVSLHKRLIKAYNSDDPVASMEKELGASLLEVLNRED
ncbi:MAG: hypothetical protein ISS66_15355 [Desulfobacteraceae bacterium]|nr:hypothetical protein [Desulfobacteraceae bacterium]